MTQNQIELAALLRVASILVQERGEYFGLVEPKGRCSVRPVVKQFARAKNLWTQRLDDRLIQRR